MFKKYLDTIDIKGIIQVGANIGQEISLFKTYTNNILAFEPSLTASFLFKNKFNDIDIFNIALGNEDGIKKIYKSSNMDESSSLLRPKKHINIYPDILFNDKTHVTVNRFTTFMKNNPQYNYSNYNVLVIDTQGYDLNVIKEFDNYINNMDLVIAEYINVELYEGNQGLHELNEYMISKNFTIVDTFDENNGAGNVVFRRNNV